MHVPPELIAGTVEKLSMFLKYVLGVDFYDNHPDARLARNNFINMKTFTIN